jgi:hypothetical protein
MSIRSFAALQIAHLVDQFDGGAASLTVPQVSAIRENHGVLASEIPLTR